MCCTPQTEPPPPPPKGERSAFILPARSPEGGCLFFKTTKNHPFCNLIKKITQLMSPPKSDLGIIWGWVAGGYEPVCLCTHLFWLNGNCVAVCADVLYYPKSSKSPFPKVHFIKHIAPAQNEASKDEHRHPNRQWNGTADASAVSHKGVHKATEPQYENAHGPSFAPHGRFDGPEPGSRRPTQIISGSLSNVATGSGLLQES